MQTDGYELYDALRREQPGKLRRIGCVAHSRRRFYKALLESCSESLWFIGQMRQLYQLERELKNGSPQERHRARLAKAPAIWLAMKRRAQALRADPRVLPQGSLGKAVNYFLNEYTALVGYLRDGRFEIDSNLIENVTPSLGLRFLCRGADNAEYPRPERICLRVSRLFLGIIKSLRERPIIAKTPARADVEAAWVLSGA